MRQPKICERKRNGKINYYCELDGKQHGLGTDREQADILFGELLSKHNAREELLPTVQPAKAEPLKVRAILLKFLEWVKVNRAAGTFDFYSQGINSFDKFVGEMLVADFGPATVEDWIAAYSSKSDSYRHNLIRSVQAAFNWAVKRKMLKENPLAGLEKPAQTAREAYITDEQWAKIAAAVDGPFRDFLEILRETGCRPIEARVVTAENFDRENRRWYFADPPKKTGKVGSKQVARIVYLNDKAFAICERLALKNPTGPLFLNEHGGEWLRNTITTRCFRMKKQLGFSFCAYGLRHAFCTNKLRNGVDPVTVATLMGHSDLTQIMATYQKLGKCTDHLRAAVAV